MQGTYPAFCFNWLAQVRMVKSKYAMDTATYLLENASFGGQEQGI